MNKIDITKKYVTRDGHRVKNILISKDRLCFSGYVDGRLRVWDTNGKNFTNSSFDLLPDPEGGAVTFARAKCLVTEAMTLCDDIGFSIEALVHEIIDASKNVDMVRKWKTRSGEAVTILTVSAPHGKYPVIGYGANGAAHTWTKDGRINRSGTVSHLDLVPDEFETNSIG